MAYEDWDSELRDAFEDIPGVSMFRDYEYEIAEELFDRGFTHHADEDDYDADDVKAAREEFFDFTGVPDEFFPWDEWREAMGYD